MFRDRVRRSDWARCLGLSLLRPYSSLNASTLPLPQYLSRILHVSFLNACFFGRDFAAFDIALYHVDHRSSGSPPAYAGSGRGGYRGGGGEWQAGGHVGPEPLATSPGAHRGQWTPPPLLAADLTSYPSTSTSLRHAGDAAYTQPAA